MQRQKKSSDHLGMALTLESIGWVYGRLDRYNESIVSYLEALVIKKERLGHQHNDISVLLNSIGLTHFRGGHYNEALRCFEESISIQSKAQPLPHQSIAVVKFNIAMVYLEMHKYTKALESFHQSLDFERLDVGGKSSCSIEIILTLERIGLVYEKMKCPNNASYIYKEATKLRSEHSL